MNPKNSHRNTPTGSASVAAGPSSDAVDNSLDTLILGALSRAPRPRIPAGFAARVAQQAAAQPLPSGSRWIGWGPRLTLASTALLTLVLFALAPHATPSLTSARFDAELVAFAELSALALFTPRLLRRD